MSAEQAAQAAKNQGLNTTYITFDERARLLGMVEDNSKVEVIE